LTALLGIVGEQPPQLLSDSYAAVIEARDLVIAELPTDLNSGTNASTTAGNSVIATVPVGEQHIVIAAEAVATINDAGTDFISVELLVRSRAATSCAVAVAERTSADGAMTATRQVVAPWVPPALMVLKAGEGFQAILNELVGAANAGLTVVYLFRRVRV
jgi:hypothetical protein